MRGERKVDGAEVGAEGEYVHAGDVELQVAGVEEDARGDDDQRVGGATGRRDGSTNPSLGDPKYESGGIRGAGASRSSPKTHDSKLSQVDRTDGRNQPGFVG